MCMILRSRVLPLGVRKGAVVAVGVVVGAVVVVAVAVVVASVLQLLPKSRMRGHLNEGAGALE